MGGEGVSDICADFIVEAREILDQLGEQMVVLERHPDDRDAARRAVAAAFAARRAFAVEYRLVRPDGTERRVRDAGEPFRDEAGRVVGMRGVLQDLSA